MAEPRCESAGGSATVNVGSRPNSATPHNTPAAGCTVVRDGMDGRTRAWKDSHTSNGRPTATDKWRAAMYGTDDAPCYCSTGLCQQSCRKTFSPGQSQPPDALTRLHACRDLAVVSFPSHRRRARRWEWRWPRRCLRRAPKDCAAGTGSFRTRGRNRARTLARTSSHNPARERRSCRR